MLNDRSGSGRRNRNQISWLDWVVAAEHNLHWWAAEAEVYVGQTNSLAVRVVSDSQDETRDSAVDGDCSRGEWYWRPGGNVVALQVGHSSPYGRCGPDLEIIRSVVSRDSYSKTGGAP